MTAPARIHCGQIAPPLNRGELTRTCTLPAGHKGTVVVAKLGTYCGHAALDGKGRVLDTWVSKT